MTEYNSGDWYWIVDGDDSQYWSSSAGGYVGELPAGAGLTRIANEVELTEVLAVYGLPGPIPVRRRVDKWLIIDRVAAAGKGADAMALLTTPGNEVAFFKWNAPVESVYFDDPDTVAMVTALGLDPDEILAP